MSGGLSIAVDLRGNAPEAVRALGQGLQPARLQPVAGRAARNVIRTHLLGVNRTRPNALGGPRTNFYASAARGTQFRVQGDTVIVSINQVGIALRYFGGTVRPRLRKYLTIPAIPEAHGKRASEFNGLSFAFERHPRFGVMMPALVQGAASLLGFRRGPRGTRARFIGERRRRVVFWLVKSATFKADPTVLPHDEQIAAAAASAINDYARLLWQRRQPPAPGGVS